MSDVLRPRRYYLLKRLALASSGDEEMSLVFKTKQQNEPGTALPIDFPSRAALILAGYTALEDVNGADVNELRRIGLSSLDAKRVLNAATAAGV